MGKLLTCLGLMSGTSGDGVDASIIKSDGDLKSQNDNIVELICDKFFEYDNKTIKKIHSLRNKINFQKDLKTYSDEILELQREITLFHAKVSKEVTNGKNIDLIGFHGHTIYHNPKEKISKQLGDATLLNQLLGKKIIFNFRNEDILNGGEGAPLAPLYHYAIGLQKKITLPFSFLNIGGISNITAFNFKDINSFKARDIGPGNCLIDRWIRENSNLNYDKNGNIAKAGKVNEFILEQVSEHRNRIFEGRSILELQRSLDIKNYDISFIRGLNLEDGAATITEYTAELLSCAIVKFTNFDENNNDKKITKLILTGGGRKNIYLINRLKEKLNKNFEILMIDEFKINGDFVESQAFAFLAIRSIKNLSISYPNTTGCKKASSGGELFDN